MITNEYTELVNKYPSLFVDGKFSYVECDKGWFQIIDKCCNDIITTINSKSISSQDDCVHMVQIKEKFGCLRIYAEILNEFLYDDIYLLIADAERKSSTTCECCGNIGKLCRIRNGRWLKTLCDSCNEIKINEKNW